ncbi:MAG: hypothetical protein ABIV07_04720 [Polaromonas sp.]
MTSIRPTASDPSCSAWPRFAPWAGGLLPAQALAQSFPDKPITLP